MPISDRRTDTFDFFMEKVRSEFDLYDFIVNDRIVKLENLGKRLSDELEFPDTSFMLRRLKNRRIARLFGTFCFVVCVLIFSDMSCQIMLNRAKNTTEINVFYIAILMSLISILFVVLVLHSVQINEE